MTASAGERVRPPRGASGVPGAKWAAAAFGAVLLSVAVAALVAPVTASGDASTVQIVTDATYGTVLANSAGLPLYTLKTDHNGKSTCTGACLQAWPPLTVPSSATPTAGPGVSQGALGTSVQSDGRNQVTYNGSPLYTFVSDSPDTVTGNNVAGFMVVQVQAQPTPTTTSPPAPTPTTTAAPGPTPTTAPPRGPTTTVVPTRTGTTGGGTGGTSSGAGASTAGGTGAASPTSPSGASASTSNPGGTSSSPATAAAGGTTPATGALAFTGPGDGLHLTLLAGIGATLFALVLLALLRLTHSPTSTATRE